MADEIHEGDIGTIFRVVIVEDDQVIDISTTTPRNMYFRKPSEDVLTKAGVFTTDGTDGLLEYKAVTGDLDEVGVWRIQAELFFPSGDKWGGEVGKFTVHPNIFP